MERGLRYCFRGMVSALCITHVYRITKKLYDETKVGKRGVTFYNNCLILFQTFREIILTGYPLPDVLEIIPLKPHPQKWGFGL